MIEPEDVSVGDWVRFYVDGGLVIGQVEYISSRPEIAAVDVGTDAGSVDVRDILEVRKRTRPLPDYGTRVDGMPE